MPRSTGVLLPATCRDYLYLINCCSIRLTFTVAGEVRKAGKTPAAAG